MVGIPEPLDFFLSIFLQLDRQDLLDVSSSSLFITLDLRSLVHYSRVIHKSTSLKYEPSSEPLLISAKQVHLS